MDQPEADSESHGTNHYCLVAIGRLQSTSTPNCSDIGGAGTPNEFISRHNPDGKFSFVDQRSVDEIKKVLFTWLINSVLEIYASIEASSDRTMGDF